ncbi:MAG: AraC family transcriptional regulator [Betaproteobacteria bacterium]
MDARRGVASQGASLQTHPWTQRVGPLVGLPQLIEQLGGDAARILQAARLDVANFWSPEQRVPYARFVRALWHAAQQTRCPHFGLLAGGLCNLRNFGPLGDLVRNAPTVRRALGALTVYQHLNSEGGLAFLLGRGEFVDFGYAVYHPSIDHAAPLYDATVTVAMNFMLEMCGPNWKPYEVLLSRAEPKDLAPYREIFKVTPRFNAEYSALRIRAQDLERPVAGADPRLFAAMEERLHAGGPEDFLQSVYRGLRRLMLEDRHSGDDLAQLLSLHRRTLNRRLQAAGTTFQRVLDEMRCEVAQALLANTSMQLDDIAASLGYAGVTPFMRRFKCWSGTTPGQWRRAALSSEAASQQALASIDKPKRRMTERAQRTASAQRTRVENC